MAKKLTVEQRVEIAYIAGRLREVSCKLLQESDHTVANRAFDLCISVQKLANGNAESAAVRGAITDLVGVSELAFGGWFNLSHVLMLVHDVEAALGIKHGPDTEFAGADKWTDAEEWARSMIAAEREAAQAAT